MAAPATSNNADLTAREAAPAAEALETSVVPQEFLERIPLRFAREQSVVCIGRSDHDGRTVYRLATPTPENHWVFDRIAYKMDAEVEVVPADRQSVLSLIARAYHAEAKEVSTVADEMAAQASGTDEVVLTEDVLEMDDKAPAVKLVHAMLLQAIRQRASDIHIEPTEEGVRVRFRIDGVLFERARLRAEVRDAVASRMKVMGRMDIAERRLPQDGGVTVRVGERRIDLRISTLPSQYGERVVMRLLDKQSGLMSLQSLGLAPLDLERANKLLALSHGIVLVTGPTGCGKTTTLYAMLSAMNSPELNIITLEDPVEYQLPGICQTQVSDKKGFTFARGLRALVRQDPDVIMVGEIRDLETATVAIQSALTGHLVLSTLHTNDAASSVTRLLDLGVEPFLVASSVNAAIAQRLVRRLCPNCRKVISAGWEAGWNALELSCLRNLPAKAMYESAGCDACFNTGFQGRIGIYEFMAVNEQLRDQINRRGTASEIKKSAIDRGMTSLYQDGIRKVSEGVTTLDEIRNAAQLDME
jgi:general secretion pathway protein E